MEFVGQNWREIPRPKSSRVRVWDDEIYQLGFQNLASGAVSWIVRFRVPWREHQVTKKVGVPGVMSPTQARKAAKSIMAKFTQESDLETPDTLTARDLLEDYYAKYILRPGHRPDGYHQARSYREHQRWLLDKYLTGPLQPEPGEEIPAFGDLLLSQINEGTISTLLRDQVNGLTNQNRVQALLSASWNWASRQEAYLRIFNPVSGHKKNKEVAKKSRLFDEGVRKLGRAWRESTDPLKDLCIWPLLCGCRKSASVRFGCGRLNIKERVIRFDPSEEMLKECDIIYIPECAMALTKALPILVTQGSDRTTIDRAYEAYKRTHRRLQRKAGLPESTHDMRRTFQSYGIDLGYDTGIMNLVTHEASGSGKIADTYGVPAVKTYRDIADRVGNHIWRLLHEDPTESCTVLSEIVAEPSPVTIPPPKRRKRA